MITNELKIKTINWIDELSSIIAQKKDKVELEAMEKLRRKYIYKDVSTSDFKRDFDYIQFNAYWFCCRKK